MTAQEYAFTVLAVVGSIGAVAVVTARNVVHAALYLVVTLGAVGGAYLVLAAEFVAWVQILIYVGAIVILFLFGLMLTKAPIGRDALDNQRRWLGALVSPLELLLHDADQIAFDQRLAASHVVVVTTPSVSDATSSAVARIANHGSI